MSEPFVVATTCVRRRPWAARPWLGAMAAQARKPDAVLVVVDEPEQGEGTFSSWDAALHEEGGCGFQAGSSKLPVPNWDKRKPWFLETYPHPSAPGWSRGTRESGWREPEPGAGGRYSDDRHAHLAALRNWTVERALELWPQASHLWCCDSDVAPEPEVLELLLAADKEVVAARVRNSTTSFNFMLDWDPATGEPRRSGWEDPVVNAYIGPSRVAMTGACALYRREVFERGLRWAAHPRGEDIAFAIQARKAGISLWVEPRARTIHRMDGPDKEGLR